MGRIGLFGGTFDPPHKGHIELAKRVLEDFSLDKVIFLPAGNPPHKQENRKSAEGNNWFRSSWTYRNDEDCWT